MFPSLVGEYLRTILIFLTIFAVRNEEAPKESEIKDFVLCRSCGADLADPYYLYNNVSPNSVANANKTLFGKSGVHIQQLMNPYGATFDIITTKTARCVGIGDWHNSHTWFPGFAWRYCICTQCGAHMGWIFEPLTQQLDEKSKPSEKAFYGLILENILSETFLNSFIVTPKFKS